MICSRESLGAGASAPASQAGVDLVMPVVESDGASTLVEMKSEAVLEGLADSRVPQEQHANKRIQMPAHAVLMRIGRS